VAEISPITIEVTFWLVIVTAWGALVVPTV
jgi:hypothetical protein